MMVRPVRRALGGAVVATLLVPASPARAYIPERTPHRDAEAAARRVLGQPEARGALPGIVVTRGGRTLVSINARRALTPASLMKLATTATAALRFGPAHRFATRALAERSEGVVTALYLVGGGDPTFATEAFRRRRYEPKPTDVVRRPAFAGGSPTVEQLARRIQGAGVRAVTGDLVADESLFDTRRTQRGWLPRYLGHDPDTGLLSALPVNEGRADLEGKILAPSPALSAGASLRSALAARGILVAGVVRVGKAPSSAGEVARVESPPLAEIIDYVNRYSINFHAEVLLKSLGAAFGGAGTTEAGARVVRATLARERIPLDGFRMLDGSGLSVLDRMTPATLAALMRRILTARGSAWAAVRASIPVAGEPGTLLRRMTKPPTRGNLRGKTGQIPEVRAMAGWVTASDGVPIVYVVVFNRAPRPLSLTRPLDLFGLLLARYPGA